MTSINQILIVLAGAVATAIIEILRRFTAGQRTKDGVTTGGAQISGVLSQEALPPPPEGYAYVPLTAPTTPAKPTPPATPRP